MYSSQIATEGEKHPGGRNLGNSGPFCSPCKARGRERLATRIVGWPPEPFCDACYGGEGTVFEMRGDSVGDPEQRERNREYHRRPVVQKRKKLELRELRKKRRSPASSK
jgi:hypothetical protein